MRCIYLPLVALAASLFALQTSPVVAGHHHDDGPPVINCGTPIPPPPVSPPVVRDHRKPKTVIVRDHRTPSNVVVRDHRTPSNVVVRDHRTPDYVPLPSQGGYKRPPSYGNDASSAPGGVTVTQKPGFYGTVRDHRTPPATVSPRRPSSGTRLPLPIPVKVPIRIPLPF